MLDERIPRIAGYEFLVKRETEKQLAPFQVTRRSRRPPLDRDAIRLTWTSWAGKITLLSFSLCISLQKQNACPRLSAPTSKSESTENGVQETSVKIDFRLPSLFLIESVLVFNSKELMDYTLVSPLSLFVFDSLRLLSKTSPLGRDIEKKGPMWTRVDYIYI